MTLTCDVPEREVVFPLDATRVTQVLQNLLGNALAHTPPGGSVAVVAKPAGPNFQVTVRDSGIGVAPEQLPHVFDRLYRADESRSGGNSGLGLSISKSIVEAHGGEIEIASVPGEGTTVTFSLPVAWPAA